MTKAQREEKRKVRRERWVAFGKETGVYSAAVVGVFLSPYTEPWMANEPVHFAISGGVIVRSLVFAVVAVAAMKYLLDRGGKGQPAKLAAWKRRAAISLILGLAINYVWPLVLKLLETLVS